jgi:hypothetical protein
MRLIVVLLFASLSSLAGLGCGRGDAPQPVKRVVASVPVPTKVADDSPSPFRPVTVRVLASAKPTDSPFIAVASLKDYQAQRRTAEQGGVRPPPPKGRYWSVEVEVGASAQPRRLRLVDDKGTSYVSCIPCDALVPEQVRPRRFDSKSEASHEEYVFDLPLNRVPSFIADEGVEVGRTFKRSSTPLEESMFDMSAKGVAASMRGHR